MPRAKNLNAATYQAIRSLGSTWWPLGTIAGKLRFYGYEVTDRQVARALGRLASEGLVARESVAGSVRYRAA